MMTDTPLRTDLPVPPGEYIRETLHHLGMTQQELANRMGRPYQAISEIIHGKKALTEKTAHQLEAVLDKPASVWLNLEHSYRYNLGEEERTQQLKEQRGIISSKLYSELVKLGAVEVTRDPDSRVKELLRFFRVAHLSLVEKQYACAFRKSDARDDDPYSRAARIRIAEIESKKTKHPSNINGQVS